MGQPHIAHIAPHLWQSLTGGASQALPTPDVSNPWPQSSRVVLIVVDGLGWHNVNDHASAAPFLSELMAGKSPATTGFPATTATSMATIGTGRLAGQTGLVGYSAMNPMTGAVGNFVSWRDVEPPLEIQRETTLFEQLTAAGVPVTSVSLERFAQSGLTQAAFRGAQHVAAESLDDTVDYTLQALREPGLVHMYWGEIDKVGHVHGPHSPQWIDELTSFDQALQRLMASAPAGTLCVITADHGMVNIAPRDRIDIADDYSLMRGVRAVAGEPRAPQVYTNSPGMADQVAQRWAARLGKRAMVVTRTQAQEAGLLGDVSDHVLPWCGDVLVLTTGTTAIVDSSTMTPMAIGLRGMHGSLTPYEVHVPLIAATL